MSRSRGRFDLAPAGRHAGRDTGRDAYRDDGAASRDPSYLRNQGVVISNPATITPHIPASGRAEVLRLRR